MIGAPKTWEYIKYLEKEISSRDRHILVLLNQCKVPAEETLKLHHPKTIAPRKDLSRARKLSKGKSILVCSDGKRPRKKACERDLRVCAVGNCKWFDESGTMAEHFAKSHSGLTYDPQKHTKVIFGITEEDRKEKKKEHKKAFQTAKRGKSPEKCVTKK